MGSDVGQIFPTGSLHRDQSISYALVYEKEISHIGKNNGNPDVVCEKSYTLPDNEAEPMFFFWGGGGFLLNLLKNPKYCVKKCF